MGTEIGADDPKSAAATVSRSASFGGVHAALKAELALPLRALNEGEEFLHSTFGGEPVPPAPVRSVIQALIGAVLSSSSGFTDWRYGNDVGQEQLRGLSDEQVAAWRQTFSTEHEDCQGVRTHEDCEGELGFFWATKIGGPSHGFDFEAQCLLPLLANARHKVILVSNPSFWPHPLARTHFRLLWVASLEGSPQPESEARLWLEAVNLDFSADEAEVVDIRTCTILVLRHAIRKATEMQVVLSVSAQLLQALQHIAKEMSRAGTVRKVQERLVLRP